MYKTLSYVIMMVCFVLVSGCEVESIPAETDVHTFKGVVKNVDGMALLVIPDTNEEIANSGDLVWVESESYSFIEGDEVLVIYDGEIMESYPLQVNSTSVQIVEDF